MVVISDDVKLEILKRNLTKRKHEYACKLIKMQEMQREMRKPKDGGAKGRRRTTAIAFLQFKTLLSMEGMHNLVLEGVVEQRKRIPELYSDEVVTALRKKLRALPKEKKPKKGAEADEKR